MRVPSSKMRVSSFDRCIFRIKFPTGFTYRNLRGFAAVSWLYSAALVLVSFCIPLLYKFSGEVGLLYRPNILQIDNNGKR